MKQCVIQYLIMVNDIGRVEEVLCELHALDDTINGIPMEPNY